MFVSAEKKKTVWFVRQCAVCESIKAWKRKVLLLLLRSATGIPMERSTCWLVAAAVVLVAVTAVEREGASMALASTPPARCQ